MAFDASKFRGTEYWWQHPKYPTFQYTDGVKAFVESAQADWLLEHIFSYQAHPDIYGEPFQVWVASRDGQHIDLTTEDGNERVLLKRKRAYSSLDGDKISLWLVNGSLMLPSEY